MNLTKGNYILILFSLIILEYKLVKEQIHQQYTVPQYTKD